MNFIKTRRVRRNAINNNLKTLFFIGTILFFNIPKLVLLFTIPFVLQAYALISLSYVSITFSTRDVLNIYRLGKVEKLNIKDIIKIDFTNLSKLKTMAFGSATNFFGTSYVVYPVMTMHCKISSESEIVYKSFVDINDFSIDEFIRRVRDANPLIICDDVEEFRKENNEKFFDW